MKKVKIYIGLITLAVAFYSCQKPIDLKATTTNANILVVEGLINTGTDLTTIKLSRTVTIANKTIANPEGGAVITIENAQATVATLKEISKGNYSSSPNVLNLDRTKQYRLRVKTSNGQTYLSDLVDVKITPPIDSVGYTYKNNGIQIYANAHDDTNNSRYYLYDYAEAWIFNTRYYSSYYSTGSGILARTPTQVVSSCFSETATANIFLNSTAALSQDISYQFPLIFIEGTSERISVKYSILINQTVLTKEAYAFWENLKKNTESLGSIFDVQPSQLIGNIHNIADPAEPVIGYISAGTTQSKRIYINKRDLPSSFITKYPYSCRVDTAKSSGDIATYVISLTAGTTPLNPNPDGPGYLFTDRTCADCTTRGKVQKPAFWQ
ncbi:hypothetical protein GCM10027049_03970 [Mucilaginibacter puniceus]